MIRSPIIGIRPIGTLLKHARLFDALADVFEVVFCDGDLHRIDEMSGLITCDGDVLPELSIPSIYMGRPESRPCRETRIHLADNPVLGPIWRGRTLRDDIADGIPPLRLEHGEATLASREDRPLWATSMRNSVRCDRTSAPLLDYDADKPLRLFFCEGRFLRLFPLLHFVAHITGQIGWTMPRLRACITVDDPNLHSPRYGFIDFAKTAHQAARRNYHVAVATIPFDTWYAHPKAVAIFRSRRDYLSLTIHGNDHYGPELASNVDVERSAAIVAQALKRATAFTGRTGLPVDRVMVPPHERYNLNFLRSMYATGYAGISTCAPYDWAGGPPANRPLAGWFPADLVVGGFPIFPRYPLLLGIEDLPYRSWLSQPLVFYSHDTAFATTNKAVAATADSVNDLGSVEWLNLGRIADSNFARRTEDGTLALRLFSRRIRVPHDGSYRQLRIETPPVHGTDSCGWILINGESAGLVQPSSDGRIRVGPIPMPEGRVFSVELRPSSHFAPDSVPAPPMNPWAAARRFATEARDRLRPIVTSASKSRSANQS